MFSFCNLFNSRDKIVWTQDDMMRSNLYTLQNIEFQKSFKHIKYDDNIYIIVAVNKYYDFIIDISEFINFLENNFRKKIIVSLDFCELTINIDI